MNALHVLATSLVMGIVISVPPGPAGVIILNQSLQGERAQAARAMWALLGAELLAMTVSLAFLARMMAIAAWPWLKPAAGLFLIVFAASAWRSIGTPRGFRDISMSAVFRITILNPVIWTGAVSMLTIASTQIAGGLLHQVLFVAGIELGAVAWYLGVIFGARQVPPAWQRWLERAAVLVIFASGAWLVVMHFAGVLLGAPSAVKGRP